MPSDFIQRIAETSKYLSFYYSNVPESVKGDINALAHKDMQKIAEIQLEAFRARQLAAITGLNGHETSPKDLETLGEIFDTAIYQEGLNEILEPVLNDNGEVIGSTANYGLDNIEQAVAELKTIVNSNDIGDKLALFSNEVIKILESVFVPNQGTIQSVAKQMFLEYARANVSGVSSSATSLTAAQTSRTVNKIVRDVLAKENKEVFNVNAMDKEHGEMNKLIKKFLLIVAALPEFQAAGMKSAYVRHGSSSARKRVNGENEILDEFAAKVYKAAEWMRAMGAEVAVRKAAIDGNKKLVEEVVRVNGTIESYRNSSDWLEVGVDLKGNDTFKHLLNVLNQSGSVIAKQVSKADTGFTINNGVVQANLGFSVKAGKTVEVNPLTGRVSGIHLQSGTPLSTLLFREIGLNSASYFAVIQLLAANADEGDLDGQWEEMKKRLTYLAAVNTLMGSSIAGQALFMVLDGRVISMGNILSDIFSRESSSEMLMRSASKDGYGLNRSDYVALNRWVGADKPTVTDALQRSRTAWSGIADLLYNTKINIMLNLDNVFSLM